ncbi:hypothetical protein [Zhongshania marina]|uniref:Uncharacterized protein n=1 Tax=Zhongshania marina TaxID=2304603 RepID=A0A2S4HG13_9GAMM|nr:hypothetical protein [Marortus luteolus]POP52916.1 hypothetical protein C0068_09855 [Marortus luteolus]
MRTLKALMAPLILVSVGLVHAKTDLVSGYTLYSDEYLFSVAKKCLLEHQRANSNTIDKETGLPVPEIDTLGIGIPFVVNTVGVEFSSSKNAIHSVWSMSCSFDRYTSEIRSISSLNPSSSESDNVNYPHYDVPEEYKNEEKGEVLMFGVRLNYAEFVGRIKHESVQ